MDAETAHLKWNCSVDDVTAWCRNGNIPNAEKVPVRGFVKKWVIPDETKRPLDRSLQRELIWRILQVKNDPSAKVDLTVWGVPDLDVVGYYGALIECCLIKRRQGCTQISSVDDLVVTEAGFKLIGYPPNGHSENQDIPKVLQWSAKLAGYFAGTFVRSFIPLA